MPNLLGAIRMGACCAVLAMVTACTVTCPSTEIGKAARYTEEGFLPASSSRMDRWVENPRLDDFLHRKIQSDGLASTAKRYGLQCEAAPVSDNCPTCSVCTTSFKGEAVRMGGLFAPHLSCGDHGQVSVRAEIGPGSTVKSMTYWANPPKVRTE